MTTEQKRDGSSLIVFVEGKVDTVTAPDLQKELDESLDGVTALTLDISNLSYISSAGLRVLLATHKKMVGCGGNMKIKGANETVTEIFDMTGFSDILNIE